MNFDVDIAIFVGFLLANLTLGLVASRGVNTIRSFAVGDKNFSTATIVATVLGTWISGSFFFTIISTAYTEGISFMTIFVVGNFLSFVMMSRLLIPLMSEFLGSLSIAEAMGSLYGRNVRIITSIAGIVAVSGIISIQLKIAGSVFEYALNIKAIYGIILSGVIITLYSSLGGIKSVTFTDVIQFGFFGVMVPAIAYFLFKNVEMKTVENIFATNPLFDWREAFSFSNPRIYYYISLFFWVVTPSFNPAVFQRIVMAKDVKQASEAFLISSGFILFFAVVLCWIGLLILSISPDVATSNVLQAFVSDYEWIIGFKGLILAGIMAMVMSTVDSYINSTSVLLTYDLKESLGLKIIKDELSATRFCSLFIGVFSILFAMRESSFLDLFILASTLYIPIVTVPFIMSVFGFRSSGRSVLAGMGAGFFVVVMWETLLKEHMAGVGGLLPGMLANLITLIHLSLSL